MQLHEFNSADEARAHVEYKYNIVTSNILTMLLVKNEVYTYVTTGESDVLRAVTDRLKTQSEFDFRPVSSNGQANLQTIQNVIDAVPANDDVIKSNLVQLKQDLIAYSAIAYNPYNDLTDEYFAKVKYLASSPLVEVNHVSDNFFSCDVYDGITVFVNLNTVQTFDVGAEVYVSYCSAVLDGDVDANFTAPIKVGDTVIGKDHHSAIFDIPFHLTKHKTKVFVKLNEDVEFTTSAELAPNY